VPPNLQDKKPTQETFRCARYILAYGIVVEGIRLQKSPNPGYANDRRVDFEIRKPGSGTYYLAQMLEVLFAINRFFNTKPKLP